MMRRLAIVFCIVVAAVGPSMALPTAEERIENGTITTTTAATTSSSNDRGTPARQLRSRISNDPGGAATTATATATTTTTTTTTTTIPQDLPQLHQRGRSTEAAAPTSGQHGVLQVCRRTSLTFARAANGRTLQGGEFVMGEWFHKYGVSISARGHDGDHNLHPMVFDSSGVERNGLVGNRDVFALGSPNFECGGFGRGRGGMVGGPGENCKTLGNLLVPSRKPGSPTLGSTSSTSTSSGGRPTWSSPGGILVFHFSRLTKVRSIDLLNVGERDQVTVFRGNGDVETFDLVSKGPNGFQSVPLGLDQAQQLVVTFHSFAAVAGLDLCIVVDQ
eukprot:CAMPEP_0172380922 /NCGR_PEP_ID=MMETSP1060-20121228/70687_1 /TAXON_ID=37318 /ORGANISM="Pseudo-nitzschia pungens, Strain cf. cingulata" /LENGTH=331 /DNA_ID=CAMNT_0013108689 /DNA_START=107 /DNA_END=1102 /DNA_ORIENTATION=+